MLRIVEQAARSDTGRQRHANEDAYFVRPPVFVVADGMGGAQAGEVASKIATETFDASLDDADAEAALAERARAANREIFELARGDESRSGMGTTLTGAALAGDEVSIVHVGDSRAYLLRDGELRQLTRDHSLVEELRRQGRLTTEEAEEHPQRSIITRALGPEPDVELDVHSHQARPGDVFLLCSDGLTSMVREDQIRDLLAERDSLEGAVGRLVDEANRMGGRDNITVVAFQIGGEPSEAAADELEQTIVGLDAGEAASARRPDGGRPERARPAQEAGAGKHATAARPRRGRRRAIAALVAIVVIGAAGVGAVAGLRNVYFVGQDEHGLVALYRGLPYELPAGIKLYSEDYVSSTPAAGLSPVEHRRLLDHQLRSRKDAADVIRTVERGGGGR